MPVPPPKPPAITADHYLDITGLLCPMTFVRTKLMLEKIAVGDILEVRLKGKEPLENVPRSARQHGHNILAITPDAPDVSDPANPIGADIYKLWIQKQA